MSECPATHYADRQGPVRAWVRRWWLSGSVKAANCVAAYQPKGAASYATSKVNLANPGTYDAADGAAFPSWAVTTGWSFTAALSQYLTTGIIPASGYSGIVQIANVAGANRCVFGELTAGNNNFGIRPDNTGATTTYASGQILEVAPVTATGNLCVAGQRGYKNGVADGGAIGAWGGVAGFDIWIGAWNNSGVLLNPFEGDILALAIYDYTLTALQITDLAAAMAAL